MPRELDRTDPRHAAMERAAQQAAQQAAQEQQERTATGMVNDMRAELAANPAAVYSTSEQLEQALAVNRQRETHVRTHAAELNVTTYSETEEAFSRATDQALESYRASHAAYVESESHENYNRMLQDGTVYVALQYQGQQILEDRLNNLGRQAESTRQGYDPVREAAQGNANVAQAARGTLPSGSRSTSREQPTQASRSAHSQGGDSRKRQKQGRR
ncbi:hypothetical protein ABTZ59_12380 [Streptomyces sp. NPDC094034]|uniref:hypothetical protein n=1 Tax=Streptomyces sp. NPDC094034 TaxID=3155309 RepID=UPI0033189CE3